MAAPKDGEGILTVSADGRPLSAEDAGEGVGQVNGKSAVLVQEPRMYGLLQAPNLKSRLLEISTSSPALEAYAFTFVSSAGPQLSRDLR
jgi:hypothetical protein